MSRATEKTKWRNHASFATQRKAENKWEELQKKFPDETFVMFIKITKNGKRRYVVRSVVRKGVKK